MPPTVALHGIRKSDQKQWLLVVVASNAVFRPSPQPVPVGGIIIEGNPLWFLAKVALGALKTDELTLVSGTVTFEAAAREPDAPVRGRLELDVGRLQGGDYLTIG